MSGHQKQLSHLREFAGTERIAVRFEGNQSAEEVLARLFSSQCDDTPNEVGELTSGLQYFLHYLTRKEGVETTSEELHPMQQAILVGHRNPE